jgi:hypothetical protein
VGENKFPKLSIGKEIGKILDIMKEESVSIKKCEGSSPFSIRGSNHQVIHGSINGVIKFSGYIILSYSKLGSYRCRKLSAAILPDSRGFSERLVIRILLLITNVNG